MCGKSTSLALLRMKVIGFLRTVFYARVNHVGFDKISVFADRQLLLVIEGKHALELCLVRVPRTRVYRPFFFFFFPLCRGSTEAVAPGGARTRRPNPRTVQTELAPGKVASARYLADIYNTDRFSRCDGASAPFI